MVQFNRYNMQIMKLSFFSRSGELKTTPYIEAITLSRSKSTICNPGAAAIPALN